MHPWSATGALPVPGGRVWFGRTGRGLGRPLLVVHGGPGLPHRYLESLARLSDERDVIFWDQLGCGRSERPRDHALWTMARSVAEMHAVVDGLALRGCQVFGHSWGAMLAQQYVLDHPTAVASLTISNSAASISRFSQYARRLKADLVATQDETMDELTVARIWNHTHMCRLDPWPAEFENAFRDLAVPVFETMFGADIFEVTGTMATWDVTNRLAEITVPTLLIAGRYDECSPGQMREMSAQITDSRFELFESSSHSPFIEEPSRFDEVMRAFLAEHD